MNSSEKTYLQKLFLLSFLEPENFNDMTNVVHSKGELADCDEEIRECNEMLQYSIDIGNKTEIKNWKQLLQQAKTRKRILRKMIETNTNGRDLITP